jgi:hypothetical protein
MSMEMRVWRRTKLATGLGDLVSGVDVLRE